MNQLILKDLIQYVEENIGTFHEKRIARLEKLKIKTVLKKKNPYLFKAKHFLTSEQIIKALTEAFISSNEETVFGDWLEGLAIFINQKVYNGWKSGIPGIDLEFDKNDIRYIVSVKSGPNWGNSSQITKMRSDFLKAKRTLRTSNSGLTTIPVNGCCYGCDHNPDKGDYFKYCGQYFWEFISGKPNPYKEIIEPIGHKAKEKNDIFLESYSRMINKFTKEFSNDFCSEDDQIDWNKLVEFNSAKK